MIDQPQATRAFNPNGTALEMLSETQRILQEVVTSSESFDYRKAKDGIRRLNQMIRELAREEARLRALNPSGSGSKVLPFPINPGPA